MRFDSLFFKSLSVMTNKVGLQTDDTGHVGQKSSAHLARVVGLQTNVVRRNRNELQTHKETKMGLREPRSEKNDFTGNKSKKGEGFPKDHGN